MREKTQIYFIICRECSQDTVEEEKQFYKKHL